MEKNIDKAFLLSIGFKEIPHYTVMGNLTYDLGRRRHISIGSIGTPNEMGFICEVNKNDPRKMDDLVCIHNWDDDGFMKIDRIEALIYAITGKEAK